MLKLKRVELQGFKSFCERTELRFRGAGVAAIVGPNGCGKSNLADAISWVLGEQSAKSLRGSRMEDVIFAGTRDRKSLGMASVTMTLVDPESEKEQPHHDTAPSAQPVPKGPREITVSRRLYRSGESDYLINGKSARLRDIQELFMGTGLGPESYAIIEQGRITQILSNKPQERRSVIEEAAGISKFKNKRRLAEAKLEGAKQNLARVFDILEEVGRQVNSLKRQAAKAKRYEEIKADMMANLKIALTGRYRLLEREATKAALDLSAATKDLQHLTAEVGEREKEHGALQEKCFSTEAQLTEERKKLAEMRVEAERTKGRLESQANQIASIDQRLTRGEAENTQIENNLERFQKEFEAHSQALRTLEEEVEVSRGRLAKKAEERSQLERMLREREQGLEAGRQQVLRLLGEGSTLKNQLAQIGEYLAGLDREAARARREAEGATADVTRITALKAELSEKLSARQLELTNVTDQRRVVEEELLARKSRLGESRRKLETLRQEFSRLKARKDSLEEVISHRSYTTESVKRLFGAIEKGKASDLKPLGVLADFVEVEPAYEKAAEEFLHEELEYVVVRDWTEAERGVDLMRGDLDGRATFLVHPEPEAATGGNGVSEPAIGPETGIVARLSSLLRLTNGLTKAPAELLPRLSRCFLVEDRGAAQRLAQQYPDLYFLNRDGVSYHGHAVSGGKKTGAGPLALKRELRELAGVVSQKQKELNQTVAAVEQLDREIVTLTEDQDRLRGLQQAREKDALALDHEQRKLSEELNRAGQRLSVSRMELQRLEQDGARAAERKEKNQQALEAAETRRHEEEQKLETARLELTRFQASQVHLNEEHAGLRAELAGQEERKRAEQGSKARLEHQIQEMAQRRQQIAAEMERLGIDRARLLQDNIGLDEKAGMLTERIAELDVVVNGLAEQEQAFRESLAAIDEGLRQRRIEAQAAGEKRNAIELDLVKRQAELKYLDETSRKELNAGLEELAQGDELIPDESVVVEAEAKAREARARIDALGPVNPQALEEFQEAQTRYDFLNTQRQDLLDSIRDTEKAIQEIDVETRKRFGEAFTAINANFREMFTTLFNGGVGEMRLTDPENLTESGIDIMASPPGKKLQNVLLLSGGERSLTAMALLLAIFRYQPSPFCVLDEVDAALDEANITKLIRLVKEMSDQTQFVIITHSKRTMEAAEAMYGVTMQEPGVSKVVSVRFQQSAPPVAATGQMALAAPA